MQTDEIRELLDAIKWYEDQLASVTPKNMLLFSSARTRLSLAITAVNDALLDAAKLHISVPTNEPNMFMLD